MTIQQRFELWRRRRWRARCLYREGKHEEALRLYSDALEEALKDLKEDTSLKDLKEDTSLKDLKEDTSLKDLKEEALKLKMIIALHSNRAACFLKMHRFRQAADECTAVLELDHDHTGALMLRAQTLVTLRDYQSALFDVNRLIHITPHSHIYHHLRARLKTQLSLAPIPESQEELEEEQQHQQKQASTPQINGAWETIPKPKGHSGLDYSRWDKVQDASSEDDSDNDDDDDDDDEPGQPQFRFRLRTVSMRPVK
ncbi:70 kDa peptidyl-prolyl isomerase [Rhynchospora pubera]|uniref:70 kDa peptidyl-prolyl isomerase n=1 Tax=Rhynchospora pubera TaxID=906938 RepID=A0AAV8GUX4_9POAL|nr:70 kDa peptidyl-prolyl isomerase [Rhynchospora pubera]